MVKSPSRVVATLEQNICCDVVIVIATVKLLARASLGAAERMAEPQGGEISPSLGLIIIYLLPFRP